MSLSDEEFRKQHEPLHVPAAYKRAGTDIERVTFALAELGEGSADQVTRHLEELHSTTNPKPVIVMVHQVLTDLYEQGRIAGTDRNGTLVYNLHKITQANDGAVDPDLLAPGLD